MGKKNELKKYVNHKVNKIKIHDRLSKLHLNNTLKKFDATNFYPSAMYDENSVYPKKETGYDFKPHKKDIFVKAFTKTFIQDGNDSAI